MTFQVPNKTSVNKVEAGLEPYVVPFAPELIELILDKLKLTTYRYGIKYDYLQIGDEVKVQNSDSKKIIGKAKIVGKTKALFKDLPIGVSKHESYKDKDHQRNVFSGYYAYLGRPIKDEDEFLILEFELLK